MVYRVPNSIPYHALRAYVCHYSHHVAKLTFSIPQKIEQYCGSTAFVSSPSKSSVGSMIINACEADYMGNKRNVIKLKITIYVHSKLE